MNANRTSAAVLAATALVGGLLTAAPASAEPEPATAMTSTATVVEGRLDGLAGNRHQLVLVTSDGEVVPGSTLRSWYCPAGARITPTWASSSCTHRSTFAVTNFAQNNETSLIGRISSTGRSATQRGPVLAKSKRSTKSTLLDANLSIFAGAEDEFRVSGTVGGRTLQTSDRRGNFGYAG